MCGILLFSLGVGGGDFVAEVALPCGGEVEHYAQEVDQGDGPEGGSVAQVLGGDAAQEDAKAHADIPGDEDGGVGRAALAVMGHGDHHVLEGRPQVAVAQSDEQGGAVVADDGRCKMYDGRWLMADG